MSSCYDVYWIGIRFSTFVSDSPLGSESFPTPHSEYFYIVLRSYGDDPTTVLSVHLFNLKISSFCYCSGGKWTSGTPFELKMETDRRYSMGNKGMTLPQSFPKHFSVLQVLESRHYPGRSNVTVTSEKSLGFESGVELSMFFGGRIHSCLRFTL